MINLEEIKDDEWPEGNFLDHVIWLRLFFQRARAANTGEKFDKICQVQNDLDEILQDFYDGQ